MTPKVLKTEADYEAALARVDELMDARPGTPEGDELELLVTLVELYEQEKLPIDLPSAVDAIRFRMEQAGLLPRDLVPFIGSRNKVSEVLGGKRRLSLRMIRSLHGGLGIPAEVLLQERTASGEARPARAGSAARRRRSHLPPRPTRLRRTSRDGALTTVR